MKKQNIDVRGGQVYIGLSKQELGWIDQKVKFLVNDDQPLVVILNEEGKNKLMFKRGLLKQWKMK